MQKCLNKEYIEEIKCLSNPACCTLLLLMLLVACTFPIVGIYCFTGWTCPPYMGLVFLEIGIIIDIFIVMFIITPCFVRLLLNCCYDPDEDQDLDIDKDPKPPKTKAPKTAYKSFSETVTKAPGTEKGRSKSLEYTENPITARAKARSRSRSKSDSEV